jgi:hypothetical protein
VEANVTTEPELWLASITTRQRTYVSSRWEEWRPSIELHVGESRIIPQPTLLRACYLAYLIRVRKLMEAQFAWDTIRKYRIDNPLLPDVEFEELVAKLLARKGSHFSNQERMGHEVRG